MTPNLTPAHETQFLNFLQEDLAISAGAIAMALRHREKDSGPLPMILWKYGLVTLEQLDHIFDWLETVAVLEDSQDPVDPRHVRSPLVGALPQARP